MADQTLTLTYSTSSGRVTQSGLTSVMPVVMQRILTQLGISFQPGESRGRLLDKTSFGAEKRAAVVTAFNAIFDQDPNPAHATDNFTLVLTAA